ncbi:MAG: WecB/TagA/CpsF family glycosyltransferase [Caldilineaceae bacterium]
MKVDVATVEILGVKVHCVDFARTLAHLGQWIEDDSAVERARKTGRLPAQAQTRQVCTVNPEFIMHARRDPTFANVLGQADLCVPDGVGVLWAARRQRIQLHERVTGSDGVYHICQRAAERGWRVYLLGAAAGVADAAAQRLMTLYPGLKIVGTYSGSPADTAWAEIRERLHYAQPDILFVAYGHPHQDLWIARHRQELPTKVAIGVGGAFDFVAGIMPRAPSWMQRWGVEWLYRLIQQPWRWRRMAVLPRFALLVLIKHQRKFTTLLQ